VLKYFIGGALGIVPRGTVSAAGPFALRQIRKFLDGRAHRSSRYALAFSPNFARLSLLRRNLYPPRRVVLHEFRIGRCDRLQFGRDARKFFQQQFSAAGETRC
jgi:hypothetical protein